MKNCKVAFIGAGNMAREHAKAFASLENVELCGITSRTEAQAESLAKQYNITKVCRSVEELYESTHADLVVVTVSVLAINEIARGCFRFPWTVLLEKPAGHNLQEASALVSAANASGRSGFVALNRRFYSTTRTMLESLNKIDSPRFVSILDQEDPQEALAAGQPAEVVKFWMYANSIHLVDYFTMACRGDLRRIKVHRPWLQGDSSVVLAELQFDSGDTGLYQGIWNGPAPWSVQAFTPKLRWELRPLEKAVYQKRGERQLISIETHQDDLDFKPGLRLQAKHAVAAALGQAHELPTLEESLRSMRLIHSIFGV